MITRLSLALLCIFRCDFMILGHGVGAFATVYAADEA